MGQLNKDPSTHTWMDSNENGNVNIIRKEEVSTYL